MIKNVRLIEKLEKDFIARQRLSHKQSLHLFESLWNEAVRLGVLPSKDPLEGIDVDIKIAKVIHSCSKKSSPG
jgi:hypothetical protein